MTTDPPTLTWATIEQQIDAYFCTTCGQLGVIIDDSHPDRIELACTNPDCDTRACSDIP